MDDGRLLQDELFRRTRTSTSGAVIHRDSSITHSYPKYSTTVSNIKSNKSDENIKLIKAAAMGLVSRNSVDSRGLATAVQEVMKDEAIRLSFRDDDADTPSESDSEDWQDNSTYSGSTQGVHNISHRSSLAANSTTSNASLRSEDSGGNGGRRVSKQPGRGNGRSKASFLKDRRLSTVNNANRGLMSEGSRRRMLEGFGMGSARKDVESVTDSSDSEEEDGTAQRGASGGANNVAASKAKGNSGGSSTQAMPEIRNSSSSSRGPTIQSLKTHRLSKGEMRGVRRGIASNASMMMFSNDALELAKVRSCHHLP